METILYIVLSVTLILVVLICVIALKKFRSIKYHSDIHMSGGVNIETGQLTSDNNYFKGFSDTVRQTVTIEKGKPVIDNVFMVNLTVLSSGEKSGFVISKELIIGRAPGEETYVVANDRKVSRRHCKLFVQNGCLYITDLNSSNHTFLNGNAVQTPEQVKNRDIIKVGFTELMIEYQ